MHIFRQLHKVAILLNKIDNLNFAQSLIFFIKF